MGVLSIAHIGLDSVGTFSRSSHHTRTGAACDEHAELPAQRAAGQEFRCDSSAGYGFQTNLTNTSFKPYKYKFQPYKYNVGALSEYMF